MMMWYGLTEKTRFVDIGGIGSILLCHLYYLMADIKAVATLVLLGFFAYMFIVLNGPALSSCIQY